MNNYVFTVTQTGTIDVEANSEEEARSILEQNIGHFYVVTSNGEQPADDSWEIGDLDEMDDYYYVKEEEV
jgi:hypothetical protein|tara:strand:- start:288 stop:497 length:210 start_codon:yes stop_codon:yes gene_type:complete